MKKTNIFLINLLLLSILPLFAQQAHINVDWDPQRNTENLIPRGANVISPEVFEDHTVIFRLKAPDVSEVLLVGSMFVGNEAGKRVPFEMGEDSIWTVKIGPLEPNIYFYHFVLVISSVIFELRTTQSLEL